MVKNVAIFASGSGSNAENICKYFKNSSDIAVVLIGTNNENADVVKRAKKLDIPLFVFTKSELENFSKLQSVQNSAARGSRTSTRSLDVGPISWFRLGRGEPNCETRGIVAWNRTDT